MVSVPAWLAPLGLGVVAGTVAGLFGVGGGIIVVPMLVLLGNTFHVAKTASEVVLLTAGTRGALGHLRRRSVDLRVGAALAIAGAITTPLASYWSFQVPGRALSIALGTIMLATAVRLFLPTPTQHAIVPPMVAGVLAGMVAGVLAGLLGIGGGVIAVPVLVLLAGLPIHRAIGTSLMGIAVNGLAGVASHWYLGEGDVLLRLGVPLAVGALIGAPLGVRAAHAMDPRKLQVAFAVLLVVAALRLFLT